MMICPHCLDPMRESPGGFRCDDCGYCVITIQTVVDHILIAKTFVAHKSENMID